MRKKNLGLVVGAVALLAACAGPGPGAGRTATAQLMPTAGNSAQGTITFQGEGDRVSVRVRMSGLKPNQDHGFHIHEKGDCSAPDATSAGGHFNPGGAPHGAPDGPHHAGDMPALKSDASGMADAGFVLQGVSVGGDRANIVGLAVIVHAAPDDYRTQPTGNSGARIACGVIRLQG